jgi:hypothetical protein
MELIVWVIVVVLVALLLALIVRHFMGQDAAFITFLVVLVLGVLLALTTGDFVVSD